jgi:uncharacterized protein YjbI with pentapeptide repeats
MEKINLTYAHLCGTDMTGVHMPNGILHDAYLYKCSCRHANLVDSDLRKALLVEADFTGSNLTKCDLRESDLRFANLRNAVLTKTQCDGADFLGADLREASVPHIFDGINVEHARTNRPILRLVKNPLPHLSNWEKDPDTSQSSKHGSLQSK